MATTHRNPVYFLGTRHNGYLYCYTELGLHKTAELAVSRCQDEGAMVFRQLECWSNGVNYGLTEPEHVATIARGRKVGAAIMGGAT